jgi:hypothetical protein
MEAPLHLKPGVFLLPETFNLEKICKAGADSRLQRWKSQRIKVHRLDYRFSIDF